MRRHLVLPFAIFLVILGLAIPAVADDQDAQDVAESNQEQQNLAASSPNSEPSTTYMLVNPRGERRKEVRALRINEPIRIDGKLDEKAWQQAPPTGDWVETVPNFPPKPPVHTEGKVLYDDEGIYFGMKMEKYRPEEPLGTVLNYNNLRMFDADDVVGVILGVPEGAGTSMVFLLNGANTHNTAVVNSLGVPSAIDQNFDSAVHIEDKYWYAEIRIRWQDLPLGPAGRERLMLMNFERLHPARGAEYHWSLIPQGTSGLLPQFFGVIRGIEGINPKNRAIALPYTTITGFREQREATGDVKSGIDVTTRVTPTLSLDFTLLPDFAEVRPDSQIVNLDRFAVFRPELRPFFLTGQDAFKFGTEGVTQVFNSRTIGLDANRTERPILGGVKAYGKVGRTSVGLLTAATIDGPELKGEGLTSHTVFSARAPVGNYRFGVMGTGNYSKDDDEANGASAGVDLEYRRGKFEGLAFVAGVDNGDFANSNLAYTTRARYLGDSIRPELVFRRVGATFDPKLGFVARRDLSEASAAVAIFENYRGTVKRLTLVPSASAIWNEKLDTSLGYAARLLGQANTSFWEFGVAGEYKEDNILGGFPLLGADIVPGVYEGFIYTAFLARINANPTFRVQYIHDGAFRGGISDRLLSNAQIDLGSLLKTTFDLQLVSADLPGLDHRSTFAITSGSLLFTPIQRLAIQAIAQASSWGNAQDPTGADEYVAILTALWQTGPRDRIILQVDRRLNVGDDRAASTVFVKATRALAF